jgi:hypothetical protein
VKIRGAAKKEEIGGRVVEEVLAAPPIITPKHIQSILTPIFLLIFDTFKYSSYNLDSLKLVVKQLMNY